MKTIKFDFQFNSRNVEAFYVLLEQLKVRLVGLCVREIDGRVCRKISVTRYNMARQELKAEFPLEVIGMLDASGFINTILCQEEQDWMKARKLRSKRLKEGRLSEREETWLQSYEKKGGKL